MAIATAGGVVGSISGTIGGINCANTRNGLVIRKLPSKTNKRTKAQILKRARFRMFQNQWTDLTDLQKDSWAAAARERTFPNRLGISRYLSGFQLWMMQALNLTPGIDVAVVTPPIMTVMATPTDISTSFTAGGPFNVTIGNAAPTGFTLIRYSFCRPMTSRKFSFPPWMTYLIDLAYAPGVDNVFFQFNGKFGSPAAGEQIFMECRFIDNTRLISSRYLERIEIQ